MSTQHFSLGPHGLTVLAPSCTPRALLIYVYFNSDFLGEICSTRNDPFMSHACKEELKFSTF
jgi:hypothetical protein